MALLKSSGTHRQPSRVRTADHPLTPQPSIGGATKWHDESKTVRIADPTELETRTETTGRRLETAGANLQPTVYSLRPKQEIPRYGTAQEQWHTSSVAPRRRVVTALHGHESVDHATPPPGRQRRSAGAFLVLVGLPGLSR